MTRAAIRKGSIGRLRREGNKHEAEVKDWCRGGFKVKNGATRNVARNGVADFFRGGLLLQVVIGQAISEIEESQARVKR